jgi:energy-coupling factor transporter ATP-binding protein EcfA2
VSKYVRRVVGNIKGGCDLEIGSRTLITGPNGAGKSRVVNTIELALSGFASDIVGRPELRQGADLIALAPDKEDLYAEVQLSDDRSMGVFRVNRKSGGKTARPQHLPPEGIRVAYPVKDVVAALRGSVETARAFVLRHSGLEVTQEAISERLPSACRDSYETFAQAVNTPVAFANPIDTLLAVREKAKATSRSSNAEKKAATSLVDNLGKDLPALQPTEEEVQEAQKAAHDASAAYREVMSEPEPLDVEALREDAKGAVATLQHYEGEVTKLREAAGQGVDESVAKVRVALSIILKAHADFADGQPTECLVCGIRGAVHPPTYRARAQQIQAGLQSSRAAITAQQQLPVVVEALKTAQQNAEKKVGLFQEAQRQGATSSTGRQERIAAAYATLTEQEGNLLRLMEARASWAALQQARDQGEEAKRSAADAKALADACKEVSDALVEDGRQQFEMRVNEYLPEGDAFSLVLQEGSRVVCRFGFVRQGALHTALSGAEWARLTIALGLATMPTDENVIAILSPEERAYDGQTLASVMRALSGCPGQIIITSPVKPRGRTPKGWKVINVEEAVPVAEEPAEEPVNGGKADLATFVEGQEAEA